MNNVRWTVTFKTIKNKTAVVYIGDSTYTGSPIDIEPAANTISIDAVSEHLYDPVRTETGYLRVIDNGDLTDIMPVGAMDRPVELYVDDVLCWRGYITPATYTAEWDVTPNIVEIPLQSSLSVLSTETISDSANSFVSIARLLLQIIDHTGFEFSGLFVPVQMTGLAGETSTVPELRLSLSLYNFLSPSNVNADDPDYMLYDGRTYLEVLTAICQYFGWQAVEYADTLVLVSHRYSNWRYHLVSYTSLQSLAYSPATSIPDQYIMISNFSEDILHYDGIDHNYSVIPGYRKVSITANPNIVESISPVIDATGKVVLADTRVSGIDCRYLVIQPATNLILHRWENGVEVPYKLPTTRDDMRDSLTAQLVKNDTFSGESNKVNYNYTEYIRLSRQNHQAIVKLATLTGREGGVFPPGGALCLSLDVRSSYVKNASDVLDQDVDADGLSAYGPGNCLLNLSVGIGSKWWNGSEWVKMSYGAAPPIFQAYAGIEGYDFNRPTIATGMLENTKTLDDPYNGAEGYLMKIEELLSGKLQIIIYNYSYRSSYSGLQARALFIGNIRLDYYSDRFNNRIEPCRLYALTGINNKAVMSVNLTLSAMYRNKPGRATLYYCDEPISADHSTMYGSENILPEQHLLRGLTEMVSTPTRKKNLRVEWDNLRVWDRIIIDNRTYCISGMQTDIYNESTTLTLSSYGQS